MAQQTTGRAWLAGGHNPVVSLPRLQSLRIALRSYLSDSAAEFAMCTIAASNSIVFRARHRWVGGGSCLDYFGSPIWKSTSRRAVAGVTQLRLRSFAARLHWHASPALRKPMKAG